MPRPTLSLLIPAYNAAPYLPRLLRSAQAQSQGFDEIWIYDDCSTDNTAEVAAAHGAKVLRGDVNKGCSAGKNALARHVETDWIHFHDADDELLPDFVELAHTWMEHGKFDIVLFNYEYRDNETYELLATSSFNGDAAERDARRYAIETQINPFCGLYRRDAMLSAGGYDEDPQVLYNEDVAFHLRMAFAGLKFSVDETLAVINYRVGGSMSVKNQAKCSIAQYNVMRKTLTFPGAEHYHDAIAANLWKISAVAASLSEWDTAKRACQLAAKLAPPTSAAGKSWFRILASALPFRAIWLREKAIRLLKSDLRSSQRIAS